MRLSRLPKSFSHGDGRGVSRGLDSSIAETSIQRRSIRGSSQEAAIRLCGLRESTAVLAVVPVEP
jgi:hypothetical protein